MFPTDRNGKAIGQASATSMLILDNGLAPDGGLVANFAMIIGIDPGVHRLLVLHWLNWGPYGQPCSADGPPSLQTYDTLTTKLVSDVSTGRQYTGVALRILPLTVHSAPKQG